MSFETLIIVLCLIALASFVLNFVFNQHYEKGQVLEVLDGDSIVVTTSKQKNGVKVRLLNIDAPETGSNWFQASERFARQSSRYLEKRLKPRTQIYLEYDRQKWDEFGRLLAFVYLAKSGRSVNADLVRRGYAFYKPHKHNKKHQKQFEKLEAQAKQYKAGLWQYYREGKH